MTIRVKLLVLIVFSVCCSNLVNAAPLRQTVGGKYAAVNEFFLNKAIVYLKNEDVDSLKKLENAFLILKLKPKIRVEITKNSEKFPENIKIMLIDDELELWTTSDAVKKIQRKKKDGTAEGEEDTEVDEDAEEEKATPKAKKVKQEKEKKAEGEEDDDEEGDDDDEWE